MCLLHQAGNAGIGTQIWQENCLLCFLFRYFQVDQGLKRCWFWMEAKDTVLAAVLVSRQYYVRHCDWTWDGWWYYSKPVSATWHIWRKALLCNIVSCLRKKLFLSWVSFSKRSLLDGSEPETRLFCIQDFWIRSSCPDFCFTVPHSLRYPSPPCTHCGTPFSQASFQSKVAWMQTFNL